MRHNSSPTKEESEASEPESHGESDASTPIPSVRSADTTSSPTTEVSRIPLPRLLSIWRCLTPSERPRYSPQLKATSPLYWLMNRTRTLDQQEKVKLYNVSRNEQSHQFPSKMAKPTKSKAVEKEVIIRRISGDSNSKIARDIGIHRETVAAILTRTQAEECIVAARNRLIGMADKAVDRIEQAIKSNKREGLIASLAVLKG